MSQRNDIMNDLIARMRNHLKKSRHYSMDVGEIKRGFFTEIENLTLPCLMVELTTDPILNRSKGNKPFDGQANEVIKREFCRLNISIIGAIYFDGDERMEKLHNLVDDVEKFVKVELVKHYDCDSGDPIFNEYELDSNNTQYQAFEIPLLIDYTKEVQKTVT